MSGLKTIVKRVKKGLGQRIKRKNLKRVNTKRIKRKSDQNMNTRNSKKNQEVTEKNLRNHGKNIDILLLIFQ